MPTSQAISVLLPVLIAVTAVGLGGHDSWATLALQSGASLLFILWVFRTVSGTSSAKQRENRQFARNQRRSVVDAFPGISSLLHRVSPSRFAKPQADVEILLPHDAHDKTLPVTERSFIFGYPFKRHRLGYLLACLTLWQFVALVPVPRSLLRWLSPQAHALRTDGSEILGNAVGWEPFSLAPFLSLQDLWLWLAYLMIFTVSFQLSGSRRALRSITIGLVVLGLISGGYGIYQWVNELSRFFGDDGLGSLQATGTFGNRNHYALFQSMCFLVTVGWLGAFLQQYQGMDRDERKVRSGQALLMATACGVTLTGVAFSLSRAGLAVTMLSTAVFVWLVRSVQVPGSAMSSKRGHVLVPAAFVVASLILWLGVDPIIDRFQFLPDELSAESGRLQVWRDSVPLIGEFWMTGSGLSTFQHIFPVYRSFGGLRFYSWAHNDYVQLLVELGIPGTFLVLWLGLSVAARARRLREHLLSQPEALTLHAGYCAAGVSASLHSLTDFGLHLPANAALLAVILGVVLGVSTKKRVRHARPSEARPRAIIQEPIRLS